MKYFVFTAVAFTCIFAHLNESKAQYYPGNNDPIAQLEQMKNSLGDPMADLQKMMNDLDQRQARLRQQTENLSRKVIADYRKMTNDYTSPDHVILQRSMAAARQREPERFRAAEMQHRANMASRQAQFESGQRIHRANQEILDMGMRGHWNRKNSSDRMQRMAVNGIWERSDFVDPTNGQFFNLETNQTNNWQWNNDDTFFTDRTHTQWRHTGNGFWQELEEIK